MGRRLSRRIIRHRRIRKKVCGRKERPRMCIFRSLKNTCIQIIDDLEGRTLLSLSTQDKEIRKQCKYGGNIKAAQILGEFLAKKAQQKGIERVVFDRGGYKYHGRVKALAESARKSGLSF